MNISQDITIPCPDGRNQIYIHVYGAVLRCELQKQVDGEWLTVKYHDTPMADLANAYAASEGTLRANKNKLKKTKRKLERSINNGSDVLPSGAQGLRQIPIMQAMHSAIAQLLDGEDVV